MEPAAPSTRFVGFDTLRGIAVLRIVLYHFTTRYHQIYGEQAAAISYEMKQRDFAIPMFFVISGFVIPMTLGRCRSAGEFVFLRITRLFPAYWVCVAITFLIVAARGLPEREVPLRSALLNLTMIPRAFGAHYVDGGYWMLQVELIFYAI